MLRLEALIVFIAVSVFVGYRLAKRAPRPPQPAATLSIVYSPTDPLSPSSSSVPIEPAFRATPFVLTTPPNSDAFNREDAARIETLSNKLTTRAAITANDLVFAEALLSRYPKEDSMRDLLYALLINASSHAIGAHSYESSREYVKRAQTIKPGQVETDRAFLFLHKATGDWGNAELSARAIIARVPDDPDATKSLAFALMRLDRDREAIEVLRAYLNTHDDNDARALLARLRKTMDDERGMREQRLSHFEVRYDGDAHEEVGRGILRVLERHYATLVLTLGFEPPSSVPVILFSRQAYHNASGAPAWSGGAYDASDGRIRIPIGGLTESLSPDLDGILIHELTHSFIAARTRSVAPRELHEGLAQYMEGKRLDSMLSAEQIQSLSQGAIGGVAGFYLGALAFVEYLHGLRGQSGLNDVLATMGDTGNANEAFRRVYGKSFGVLMQEAGQYHARRATR